MPVSYSPDSEGSPRRRIYSPEVAAILSEPTMSVDPGLMRVFDIGRNQAYEMVRSGQVRSIRVGKRIRIPTAAVLQLLEGGGEDPS